MTGTTRKNGMSEILPKDLFPDFLLNGADESHEYLVTDPKFKFRGRCKPAKPQLKIFREFIGGPGSDDIAYTRYNHLSLAMLKDGLGSTIALTSKDGKAIARIGYDAWGEFRWNDKNCKKSPCKENEFESYLNRFGTTWGFGHANHNGWAFGKSFAKKLTPYLYTGRRYSEIVNQYFNRNRYYSPALGRFTSKDPIGFNGGNNLYRYADNNPLKYYDPSGAFSIDFSNRLPSYLPTERISWIEFHHKLVERNFSGGMILSAIYGGIGNSGQLGLQLRDLLQASFRGMRTDPNSTRMMVFKWVTGDTSTSNNTLEMSSRYYSDPIMLTSVLIHELAEEYLGGYTTANHDFGKTLEANMFRTLLGSSWVHAEPKRFYSDKFLGEIYDNSHWGGDSATYAYDTGKVKKIWNCYGKPINNSHPKWSDMWRVFKERGQGFLR